jgi:hypothetical protein
MRSFLIIAIMAAFALPCAAQMSAQRAKVTEIHFLKYRTSTTVAKDSVEIHTNGGGVDTTGWLGTTDSLATQGSYVNFYSDATAAGVVAKVQVQYGLFNPTTSTYVVIPVVSLGSIILDSLSSSNAKNPSQSTLFYRNPKGATVQRFIITQGANQTAAKHIKGQLVQPKF